MQSMRVIRPQHVQRIRLTEIVFAVCIATWILAHLAPIFGGPMILSISFTDDAYYYFVPAQNTALGFGSTFDQINSTNGYHPLWFVVLVGLRVLAFWSDKTTFLMLVAILEIGLWMTSARLLWRILRETLSPTAALAGIVFYMFPIFDPTFGLETTLLMAALAFGVWCIVSRKAWYWVALSLIVITLSRLDYAIFAAALGLTWAYQRPLKQVIAVISSSVVVVGLYFISNTLTFGHPFPVSAQIKTASTGFIGIPEPYKSHLSAALLAVIALVFRLLPSIRRKNERDTLIPVYVALLLALSVHAVYMSLNSGGAQPWHTTPYGVVIALGVGYIAHYLLTYTPQLVKAITWGFMVIVFGLNMVMFVATYLPNNDFILIRLYHLAEWMNSNLESDSRIALSDSGIVGYFADATIINTDGLINSPEYVSALHTHDTCALFDQWHVGYVAYINPIGDRRTVPVSRLLPQANQFVIGDLIYADASDGEYQVTLWQYAGCE